MSSRWIKLLAVGLVSGAVLIGSVGSVAADRGDRHPLRVVFHSNSFKSIQADPNSNVFEPGDELFVGGTILRFESPHDQIGIAGVHLSVTGLGGSAFLVETVSNLPHGKITAQGAV